MKSSWVAFLDLDGTLWDHLDITSAIPPFTRVSDSTISDAEGTLINLSPGAVDFVKWVRNEGGIISTCSWNEYNKAIGALEAYRIIELFDFIKISTSPDKHVLMEEVLDQLKKEGTSISQDKLFYIDDRDIHMEKVRKRFPELTFFQIWKNGTNFNTIRGIILTKLKDIG